MFDYAKIANKFPKFASKHSRYENQEGGIRRKQHHLERQAGQKTPGNSFHRALQRGKVFPDKHAVLWRRENHQGQTLLTCRDTATPRFPAR